MAAPMNRAAPPTNPQKAARSTKREITPAESVGEQALPAGDGGGLRATAGAQLGQDVGDVHADRLGGDEQLPGDLAVAAALGHEGEDLGLPTGQRGVVAGLPGARLSQ